MGYYLSCTICTFKREADMLAMALNFEETHVEQWGIEHLIEIEHRE